MATYKHGGYFHHRELPSPNQCRAAMAVTGLGYRELAQECSTTTRTLLRFLKHRKGIHPPKVEAIRTALEQRGIRFVFGERPGITFTSDAITRKLPR